jgi:hypothetical protein
MRRVKAVIRASIALSNNAPKIFVWTKTADEIFWSARQAVLAVPITAELEEAP